MSNSTDDYASFRRQSAQMVSLEYWLSQNPSGVIDHLLDRIKLGAKILARASGFKHSIALGHISVAVGFPGWHSFNAHLINLSTSPPNTVSRESIARLTQSSVFLIRSSPETSLSESHIIAFQEFGARLSIATGLPPDVVMDTVCAGFCSGSSWSEVINRSPLNTTVPLYTFKPNDGVQKTGRFKLSEASHQLSVLLDDVYQDADTPVLMDEAQRWMEEALALQPGFLEAGMCLAYIHHDQGDSFAAYQIVNAHIKQAERLIPKGYRGRIIWGCDTNRFYHRMLFLRMTIYHEQGRMPQCLRDARKQLRLNPYDNLGLRFYYPLMLLQVGDFEKAAKASRFPKDIEPQAPIVRAFSRFAIGDYPGFLQDLTKALFDLPVLRLFFLDSPRELPDGDDGYRSANFDIDAFDRFAWPAYLAVPGLQEACTQFLSNQAVQDAEAQLRACWMGFRGKGREGTGTLDDWYELNAKLKSTIPLLLAEQFTFPQ